MQLLPRFKRTRRNQHGDAWPHGDLDQTWCDIVDTVESQRDGAAQSGSQIFLAPTLSGAPAPGRWSARSFWAGFATAIGLACVVGAGALVVVDDVIQVARRDAPASVNPQPTSVAASSGRRDESMLDSAPTVARAPAVRRKAIKPPPDRPAARSLVADDPTTKWSGQYSAAVVPEPAVELQSGSDFSEPDRKVADAPKMRAGESRDVDQPRGSTADLAEPPSRETSGHERPSPVAIETPSPTAEGQLAQASAERARGNLEAAYALARSSHGIVRSSAAVEAMLEIACELRDSGKAARLIRMLRRGRQPQMATRCRELGLRVRVPARKPVQAPVSSEADVNPSATPQPADTVPVQQHSSANPGAQEPT